jgi:glycine reductase
MRLEIARYPVERAVVGDDTRLAGRTLRVDVAGLRERLAADPRLGDLQVELVAPGESVRIAGVFDLVEPRLKRAGRAGDWPGILSQAAPAGWGRTNALAGLAVTACDLGERTPLRYLDLGGAGAGYSDYAALHHLVVASAAPPGVSPAQHSRGLLEAELNAALALAAATVDPATGADLPPAAVETVDLPSLREPAPVGLPRVGYIFAIRSQQQPTYDDEPLVYGSNVRGMLPMLMHPNEVLDGGLVNGYWCFQTDTYAIQNHAVVRALAARHGRDLWFCGVILYVAPTTQPERERNLALAVRLASDVLGLDGVVITKTGGGMPETDLMLLAQGCEEAGVKTSLIAWERLTNGRSEGPLTLFSPRADAIASSGDRDARVVLPPVARVLGARDPAAAGTITTQLYEVAGAVNQFGAGHWRAVDV